MSKSVHLRHGTQECSWKDNGVTDAPLCGDKQSIFDSYTDSPDAMTCPKCSAKWAKDQMKASGRVFELKSSTEYRMMRSAYAVWIDGEHYGDVVMKGGRYGGWNIYTHDGILGEDKTSATGRQYTVEHRKFNSKEHAAFAMLGLMDRLKTRTAHDAEEAANLADWEARRDRRLREKAEENVQYALAIETINEMLAKTDPPVSNIERAALDTALKALATCKELNGG